MRQYGTQMMENIAIEIISKVKNITADKVPALLVADKTGQKKM